MTEPDELQLVIGQAALSGLFAVDVRCGEIREFTERIRSVFAAEIRMLYALCKDAADVVAYHDSDDQAVLPRLRAVVEKMDGKAVDENPLSRFKFSTENEGA